MSASAADRPLSVPAKNGSVSTRSSGSGTTRATESLRRVTSARAARFGVKLELGDRAVDGGLRLR